MPAPINALIKTFNLFTKKPSCGSKNQERVSRFFMNSKTPCLNYLFGEIMLHLRIIPGWTQ